MQRVHFAVVAPNVLEIFDTEVKLRIDDVGVSAPAVSLPMQLPLRLGWLDDDDDFFEAEDVDHEEEAELCD